MKKRNIIVLVAGVLLLLAGLIIAANAPLGAKGDFSRFMGQPDSKTGSKALFVQNPYGFYQAHLVKRFIIAALLGIAGAGLTTVGAAAVGSRAGDQAET